jgi:hypothetical protein
MKLEYFTPELDDISEAIRQIKKTEATWLSRMKSELVVIVRSEERGTPFLYNWVWVSSHNSDGAYLSSASRTAEQIAGVIVMGGWDFQPNLTITLEDLT